MTNLGTAWSIVSAGPHDLDEQGWNLRDETIWALGEAAHGRR
ncbi:hypothetical protein [Mesorhizobium sp. M1405]